MKFFNETALYKEMLLLEYISQNRDISQPDIARHIQASVSMTHNYIDNYEKNGLLQREYKSKKIVYYNITDQGIKRKQYLQILFVRELMDLYLKGRDTISLFIDSISSKQFHKVLLYGAGDVANIIVDMIEINNSEIEVVGIIDDNPNKVGTTLKGIEIMSIDTITNIDHDGIVITSYAFEDEIISKLVNTGYDDDKIVKYFKI